MKVVCVCGITKSGKTTTIEKLVAGLSKRGYRVGTLKENNFEGFSLDAEGSNTRRHRQAGAGLVGVRGRDETGLLFPGKLPLGSVLLQYLDHDFVLLEGVEGLAVPTIVTAHTKEDLAAKWSEHAVCLSGRLSSKLDEYCGKPSYNALNQTEQLIDLVENLDCEAAGEALCPELAVGGAVVELSADAIERIRAAVRAELPDARGKIELRL